MWSENTALQATHFGVPTVLDANQDFYRTGTASNQYQGKDALLQKWDPEGTLIWSVVLNNSDANSYQPVDMIEYNGSLYLVGLKTDANSDMDAFLAKVETIGTVSWFSVISEPNDQVPASLAIDADNEVLVYCGTDNQSGNLDLLLASIDDFGQLNWDKHYDYNAFDDIALQVTVDNGIYKVNGTSQPASNQWDIVIWDFDESGLLINEERAPGAATGSDQLEDGVLQSGYLSLVGSTELGVQRDAKILVLDAQNNHLWHATYDQSGLDDGFNTMLIDNGNHFASGGFTTVSPGNSDILIRKYDLLGGLVWHNTIDAFGEDDAAIDMLEDYNGNYLILANVMQGMQSDVFMYCFNGLTGALIWQEAVGNEPTNNEVALNLEANIFGDVYATYTVNGESKTKTYNYEEVNYPLDYEPFSKGSLILEANGRIFDENGQPHDQIKYTTFGFDHEYYFADEFFSTRLWHWTNDSIANDSIQRLDFTFAGSSPTHVSHISDYTRPERFNYYLGDHTFEQQQAFDVLAYPDVYEGVDAYVTTNSEGFKLVFVLKDESALLDDIAIDVNGNTTAPYINNGRVQIPTIKDDIEWLDPFSYHLGGNIADDNYTTYYIDNGTIKLQHSGDVLYPYAIQIKAGVGKTYTASAINNMDWSTFFGGDGDDGSYDMTVDPANGDLFVTGFTQSNAFPSEANIDPLTLNGQYQGLTVKFDQNAVVKWTTVIGPDPANITNRAYCKGVGLHNNLANPGKEVHVVGEYRGILSANLGPSVPIGAYQQTNPAAQPTVTELFLATLANNNGSRLFITPFGGHGQETVNAMDITTGGLLYFVGSTTQANNGVNTATNSQNPPNNHTLPVYNPAGSGAFFTLTHPNPGNKAGYVAAFNLDTYKLAYASIVTGGGTAHTSAFTELYDITFTQNGGAYCGRGATGAKLGTFNPTATLFASSLNQNPHGNPITSYLSDWPNIAFFSSVEYAGTEGWVYFGLDKNNQEIPYAPLQGQYQSNNGQAFFLRIDEGFTKWKTSFGLNSIQDDIWNGYGDSPIDIWNGGPVTQGNGSGILPGRGKMSYNTTLQTLFTAASAEEDVPVLNRTGYFFENANATTGYGREDIYLAAFSNRDHSNPLFDVFNWGTMYGANSTGTGLGMHLSREFLGDVHTYTLAGASYVLTTATATSGIGSTTSNRDKYPVSNLGFPGSWYKFKTHTGSSSDIAITRFQVTDIRNGLQLTENSPSTRKPITIVPNPTTNQTNIVAPERINTVDVYNVNGHCLLKEISHEQTTDFMLNVTALPAGVYIIIVNNTYHGKLIKL